MQFLHWLTQYESIINGLWWFTLIGMVALYILCNVLPDHITGNILPLHHVFKPHTNVDLDFQSIGYAMLHTKWVTRITHYTIIAEVMLWFVLFQSWHWSVPFLVLGAIMVQSVFIGDRKFAISFMLMGTAMYFGALYTTRFLGVHDAVLLSKVVLMTGGLVRMIGHTAELMPPLLLDDTDQFVQLTSDNVNWKIPAVAIIGYIAEFSSALPNRLFPVQVNFLHQVIFRVKPEATLPWKEVEVNAKNVVSGGYSKLDILSEYYNRVTRRETVSAAEL